jgi:hypothetical protein
LSSHAPSPPFPCVHRWAGAWEGPESCATYLKDVVRNALHAIALHERALRQAHLQTPISLPQLFNPVAFLNALRQVTSRTGTEEERVDGKGNVLAPVPPWLAMV